MIDFPASPTDGQLFSASNGVVYKYSAAYTSWLAQNPAPPLGGTGDFYATNAGAAAGGVTSTPTKITWTTVQTGNAGLWYSTSTGRYTPPAGRYRISVNVFGNLTSGATAFTLDLRKNGVSFQSSSFTTGAASYNATGAVDVVADANGTDYWETWLSAGSSSSSIAGTFSAFPLTGLQGPTGPIGQTQTVFFETGAVATGTTVFSIADTIPTNTQGDQYMQLSITPQSATSKLIIDVKMYLASTITPGNNVSVALFQDSIANALAAVTSTTMSVSSIQPYVFTHSMTSGTTNATTFRVRAGSSSAATVTFNGQAGARQFGGVMASSIVIREVP